MNLANSANPVIARILMDLGLLKSEIGTLIMTATIVDDLVNWTLFAIVLSEISPSSSSTQGLPFTILTVVVFFILVLGLGRWLGPRSSAVGARARYLAKRLYRGHFDCDTCCRQHLGKFGHPCFSRGFFAGRSARRA